MSEADRLRAVLWAIRTEGFDPNCHYCRQVQSLVEKALLGGPPVPPPQLEWVETIEENVPVYRTQHGKYSLEVVNGRSAVSWWINAGRKLVAANGGMTHVETAMEEAERALQELLENDRPTPPPASAAPPAERQAGPIGSSGQSAAWPSPDRCRHGEKAVAKDHPQGIRRN